ncbi:MAG: hypothetical protein KF764_24110 [Labilithrix sp.]|nr:hypothetical protein [Labilithrix sp.]MBX3219903.1 hypothetical protein [Labilithrix sp.]
MRLATLRSLGIVTGLLVAVGCGAGTRSGYDEQEQTTNPSTPGDSNGDDTPGGGFGGDVTGDVELDPKNTTIIIDSATDPVTRATVTYKVTSMGKDASSTAKLELADPTLGSFAGPAFLSTDALPGDKLGVSTTVKATTPDGQALGRLTLVKLRKTGAQRDFFFIVPYQQAPSPKSDVLEFGTNIKQVDVAFAMDTTGSMQGSINNLKNALSGTLLADLQAAIPNVGLAIADYRDYPVSPYGSPGSSGLPPLIPATPGDWPAKVHQKITTTLTAAQSAVNKYAAGGGGDGPESQIPAMQHILTGEALSWSGGSVAAASPAPGHFGAVDFRPGSVPVVVNITDITWHSESNVPYNFATPTMASLKTAFTAKNAFFVNVTSGDEGQANELSDATSSSVPPSAFGTCGAGQCCTGVNGAARGATGPGGTCRLNFLHNNGNGVSAGVVNAIQAISVGASYDVKAVVSNDPKNAKGVDATKFVQALRAMDEGNAAAGCPARTARDSDNDGVKDTFVNVVVGTKVCFEVIPAKNTTVPPSNEPQFYNAFVDVVGVQGNVQLDKRSVLFLVPPKDPGVN